MKSTLYRNHVLQLAVLVVVIALSDHPSAQESGGRRGEVRLTRDAIDESAGGLACYRVETPSAIYYLDQAGAGLSSMLDRDGIDWLGFHPRKGSGAAGEYRGFPNAVFREAGNYFHPLNEATDTCVTEVIEETPQRVVIAATADNGKWSGRYTFSPEHATFTLTKMPDGHRYWVLYEGVPGGGYDDTDWWMTSADPTKHPMTQNQEGDLPDPEWIAFGDASSRRCLVLHHHEDDNAADRFYQMQKKMTVFGFGREGMRKHLASVPQSFSIQFVESTDHNEITKSLASTGVNAANTGNAGSTGDRLRDYASFALTQRGDPKAGKKLFADKATQCAVCHRVGKTGGQVGPDLSQISGKYDRPHLIDSLLYPSKQIGYGYETTNIVTQSGQVISGVVKAKDADEITVADAKDKRITVPTEQIEQMQTSDTSIMPSGLIDTLNRQQFTDLIAYLETLGGGKNRMGSGIKGPVGIPRGFEMTTVATGLSGATAMEIAPDGRILICEQAGTLRVVKDGQLLREPMATFDVEMNWERGLIGVTVSPQFPKDPYVYVVYVADQPFSHHRVSRFRVDGDVTVDGSEEILLRGDDQSKFGGKVPAGHQGGAIHFGADGKLYIGIGEQTAGTPSQRMDALQGKILRLNPDGTIPSDNPFLSETSGKYQAIWAKGCRNPFTLAIRNNGEMFINDVGGKFEEINRGRSGANYGWPAVDHGRHQRPEFTDPIHTYPQSSINGGDFSDAARMWPQGYQGKYFFADFVQGWIRTIDPQQPAAATDFVTGIRRPVDLRFSPTGSLYVLLRNAWVVDDKFAGGTGSLIRIDYRGG